MWKAGIHFKHEHRDEIEMKLGTVIKGQEGVVSNITTHVVAKRFITLCDVGELQFGGLYGEARRSR